MIREKVKELLDGRMEECMRVSGKMENSMERVCLLKQMEQEKPEFGKMDAISSG